MFLIPFLVLITLINCAIFIVTFNYPKSDFVKNTRYLTFFLFFWFFGYIFEFYSNTLETWNFWYKFQYLGIPFTLPFLYAFISSYVQKPPSKKIFKVLIAVSSFFSVSAITNDLHVLYYKAVYKDGNVFVLKMPLYWGFQIYMYIVYALVIIKAVLNFKKLKTRSDRISILLALSSALFFNTLHLFGNIRFDLATVGVGISVIVMSYQVFQRHILSTELITNVSIDSFPGGIAIFDFSKKILRANEFMKNNFSSQELQDLLNNSSKIITLNDKVYLKQISEKKSKFKSSLYIVTLTDISEQKSLENLLKDEKERYQTLFNYAPIGILVEDENGYILDVNEEHCKISGYSRNEILGRHVSILAPDTDKDTVEKHIREILTGKELNVEVASKTRSDEIKYLRLYEKRIVLENGRFGILSISKDVTYERLSRETLKRYAILQRYLFSISNELLNVKPEEFQEKLVQLLEGVRTFTEIDRICVYRYDIKDGYLVKILQAPIDSVENLEIPISNFKTIYDSHIKGKEVEINSPKDVPEELKEYFGDFYCALLVPLLIDDLCYGFLSSASKKPKEFDNLEKKIFKSIANILSNAELKKSYEEELIKAKEEAESANIVKSNFLASMSHELRTPLTAIIGIAEILENEDYGSEVKKYANTIRKSSEHLLGIINDILDMEKIEAKKIVLEKIDFNIYELLDDVIAIMSTRASKKDLELILKLDEKVPQYVIGDPLRLRQVLINLLGNSIKFTQKGYILIEVKLSEVIEDDYIINFSVQDTGIGIPEDKISTIFEKFTQASASTTREFGGTGLGLAISKDLVRLMGGDISVESTLGVGTKFYFNLVLKKSNMISEKDEYVDLNNKKILLVDDNEINLDVISNWLRDWNAYLVTTTNPHKALNYLKNEHFDYIISDYNMPDMDGVTLLNKVGQNSKTVLMTSADLLQIQKEVANYVITKPVRKRELISIFLALNSFEDISNIQSNNKFRKKETQLIGKILLVEDNPVNQMVECKLLEFFGLEIDLAEDGYSAIEKISKNDYDLILMDIEMPNINGFEATRIIKSKKENVPTIVAMTAHTNEAIVEKIRKEMDDYISKPLRLNDIEKMLKKHLFAQTSPLNIKKGLESVSADRETFKDILKVFYENYKNVSFEQMELQEDIKRFFHSIKSAAYTIGAEKLGILSQEAENNPTDENISSFKIELSKVLDEIKKIIS